MAINILGKLSDLSKKEKILASLAALFVVFAGGDYLGFQPIKKRVNDQVMEISINERKIAKNNRILARKERIKAKYEKNITFIKMSGSDEEEIGKFLNEIEVISRKSEVSLIDMKPHISRDRKQNNYKRYFVEAEVEASVDKVFSFMYNLQKSSQLLRIEKFSINTKGEAISEILKVYFTITKIVVPA